MFQTMFLCAGLGTRLRPLTLEVPKPLVPLGDRPMLSHLLDILSQSGGALRVVNAHHRPERIERFLRETGLAADVSYEPELLGTAGGIAKVRDCFGPSPVVVWNADILAAPNLAGLVAGTEQAKLVLAVAPRAKGEGTCGLDRDFHIVRIRGKSFGVETQGADYMGIAALRRDAIEELPARGCLIGDYLIPLLERGEKALGAVQSFGFSDVGTPEAYWQENLRWLAREHSDAEAFVHPTARLAESVVARQSIVGAYANVLGAGALSRVIVWPGATVIAPLYDAVVMSDGAVVEMPQAG